MARSTLKAIRYLCLILVSYIESSTGGLKARLGSPGENRTSTKGLHNFVKRKKRKKGPVTCDTWHITHDMWHMTHDRWGEMNLLSEFLLPSDYGLGVKIVQRYFHKGWVFVLFNRELTDTITNWAYYPQLGISNPQLVIIFPIGDLGYMSLVTQSQRANHQSPIGWNITNGWFEISDWGYYTQLGIFLC